MPKISIIIPTRNEAENIGRLLGELTYLSDYETIVVDDSTDNTAEVAKSRGARIVQGQRKGLGQAIIDGIGASIGEIVVVMDADLSHSPEAVIDLIKPIINQGYDLVIGSRYVKGGDYSNWSRKRQIQSIIGVKLMQLVTGVRDSNSGFFAFKKSILTNELKADSWKIMLEVLFKGAWISKLEVPITFNNRYKGVSKNNNQERIRHAKHLIKLLIWKYQKFIKFAIVGGIGALWYFLFLWLLTEKANLWYGLSAIIATVIAMTSNYIINHYYTFKEEKDNNKKFFRGWLKFGLNSAFGDGIDWLVLIFLTEVFGIWYMLSALIASWVACIIKYAIANKWIWGKSKSAKDDDYEWISFYKGLPWQKRWKQLIAKTVKQYAEKNGTAGRLLDIGCGSSPCGILINHKDYIGIDPNKSKIDYMESKRLSNTLFLHGDLHTITFTEKEYFDTVIFIEVIEHLSDLEEATFVLSRIHELLRKDGKLIIATPNFGGFMGRTMDSLYGIFQKNAYQSEHQLKFSLESLQGLCHLAGYDFVDGKVLSGADMICLFKKI